MFVIKKQSWLYILLFPYVCLRIIWPLNYQCKEILEHLIILNIFFSMFYVFTVFAFCLLFFVYFCTSASYMDSLSLLKYLSLLVFALNVVFVKKNCAIMQTFLLFSRLSVLLYVNLFLFFKCKILWWQGWPLEKNEK